ncbi:efflux RND transporter periplasmic adaptor subunit [Bosea thiooxidans]|nr:HlyD family secretion protein [Bosea sp. (in: a-proteobacteria)]
MMSSIRHHGGRILLTFAMLGCAILLGRYTWDYYVNAPWTRDGRVSADVVRIAPEVSGTIQKVDVIDNQFVHRGDILFEIDPRRFELVAAQARSSLDARKEKMDQKTSVARRRSLLQGTVSTEAIEQATRDAAAANADYHNAQASLDVAKLDLERAVVRAPVDGYVTNLRLRPGDFAVAGQTAIAILDADSFRVTGYFQETQLDRIRVDDPVRILLMGFTPALSGRVESFGRGIADSNTTSDGSGLPTVEPVFNWVRLAQRIPVRVRIDTVPPDVKLAAGMTASLYVQNSASENDPKGANTARNSP